MPKLITTAMGNGRRPSDPLYETSDNPTAVPVLDVGDETHELVGAEHDAALDPEDETPPLQGVVLFFDNASPRSPRADIAPGTPMHTRVVIAGASTLHEAATEVIRCVFDQALDMPQWVASTDANLADVVAEHFTVAGYSTCEIRDISEVTA